MGGGACVVIIQGNGVQGEASKLMATADASCQLVNYLELDDEAEFNEADSQPIQDFHVRARAVIKRLNKELEEINDALAAKYNR